MAGEKMRNVQDDRIPQFIVELFVRIYLAIIGVYILFHEIGFNFIIASIICMFLAWVFLFIADYWRYK